MKLKDDADETQLLNLVLVARAIEASLHNEESPNSNLDDHPSGELCAPKQASCATVSRSLEVAKPRVFEGTFQDFRREGRKFAKFRTLATLARHVDAYPRTSEHAQASLSTNIVDTLDLSNSPEVKLLNLVHVARKIEAAMCQTDDASTSKQAEHANAFGKDHLLEVRRPHVFEGTFQDYRQEYRKIGRFRTLTALARSVHHPPRTPGGAECTARTSALLESTENKVTQKDTITLASDLKLVNLVDIARAAEASMNSTEDHRGSSALHVQEPLEIAKAVVFEGTFQDFKVEGRRFVKFRTLSTLARATGASSCSMSNCPRLAVNSTAVGTEISRSSRNRVKCSAMDLDLSAVDSPPAKTVVAIETVGTEMSEEHIGPRLAQFLLRRRSPSPSRSIFEDGTLRKVERTKVIGMCMEGSHSSCQLVALCSPPSCPQAEFYVALSTQTSPSSIKSGNKGEPAPANVPEAVTRNPADAHTVGGFPTRAHGMSPQILLASECVPFAAHTPVLDTRGHRHRTLGVDLSLADAEVNKLWKAVGSGHQRFASRSMLDTFVDAAQTKNVSRVSGVKLPPKLPSFLPKLSPPRPLDSLDPIVGCRLPGAGKWPGA